MRVESIATKEWQQFMEGLPHFSLFQLPIWAQVFENTYPNRKIATKLVTFDNEVQVLVPLVSTVYKFGFKFLESLPEGGYGGFLFTKRPSEAQVRQILQYLINKRVLYLGIYPGPLDFEAHKLLDNCGLEKRMAFTHILDLTAGYKWLWSNKFVSECRRNIRKALKSGITITLADDITQIKAYYDIYLDSVHRWGLPKKRIIPLRFFENLSLLGSDRVRFYLASYHDKYVSGGVFLYDSDSCYYCWGAMLKEFGQYCPNNLLFNKVIEDACAKGCQFFNMGSSAGLPGVQHFKESIGAEKLDYPYFVYESPFLKFLKKIKKIAQDRMFFKRHGGGKIDTTSNSESLLAL